MASFRSSLGLATTGYFVALAHIQRSSQALKLIHWDILPLFSPPARLEPVSNPDEMQQVSKLPRPKIQKSSSLETISTSRYSRIISDCAHILEQLPEADCYILEEDRVECQSIKWFKGVLNRELITSNILSTIYSERHCVLPSLKLLNSLQQPSSNSSTSSPEIQPAPLERPLLALPQKAIIERYFGQHRSNSSGEHALCEPIVRYLLFGDQLNLSTPSSSPLLSGRLGNQSVPEPLDLPDPKVLVRYDSLRHVSPLNSYSSDSPPDAAESAHEQTGDRLFQREHLCKG